MPDDQGIETFIWKGQTRYRCPGFWESGAKCEYDTGDRELMLKHIASPHLRTVPTGPGTPRAVTPTTVADTEATAAEFRGARFATEDDGDSKL